MFFVSKLEAHEKYVVVYGKDLLRRVSHNRHLDVISEYETSASI